MALDEVLAVEGKPFHLSFVLNVELEGAAVAVEALAGAEGGLLLALEQRLILNDVPVLVGRIHHVLVLRLAPGQRLQQLELLLHEHSWHVHQLVSSRHRVQRVHLQLHHHLLLRRSFHFNLNSLL